MALVKRKPLEGEVANNPYGRVYIFEIELDEGTVIHKVGMVNSDSMSRVTDRLMEVLRSFFMVYRYVPKSRIVKAKKFLIPYIVENHLHKLLAELKYKSDKKYDGYDEMFSDVDIDELVSYMDSFQYKELLVGETRMDIDRYGKICEAIKMDEQANNEKDTAKGTDELPF